MSRMAAGFLSKSVTWLGHLVERGIGQAKKAKQSVEGRGGLQPILSLESRLSTSKIQQLIHLFEDRFIPPALPLLKEKTVLEIGEGPLRFQDPIAEKKPKFFCGVVANGSEGGRATKEGSGTVVKASFKTVPFEDQFFDLVICRLASPKQGDVISLFKELGRILMPEGTAFLIDYHPFGGYAKSGTQRLRAVQSSIRGLEDYFKMSQMAELAVLEVREGFVDDTLRNQFTTTAEMAAFREIKGTPLVLFLKLMKRRKKV